MPFSLAEAANKDIPFDLHVLSAPPAFILSQDQTLMFNLSLRFTLASFFGTGLPIPFLLRLGRCSFQNLSFRIFEIALLFICQGPSRRRAFSPATAYSYYHSLSPLSTSFFYFFKKFSNAFLFCDEFYLNTLIFLCQYLYHSRWSSLTFHIYS